MSSSLSSATDGKLDQLRRKRAALEQLLALAHQLSRLQGGMGLVQQMLKPSQAPGRKVSAIEQLAAQIDSHPTAKLQEQLGALDRLIARELSSVVVLAHLTQAEFIQRYCESKGAADAAALLEKQLGDFRRNGQLNVAIRYVLHRRGVQLRAAELPIAQEAVAKRVEALRGEEQQYRKRLRADAQELLTEVDDLLAADYPLDIKVQYATTRDDLRQTLQLLDSGLPLEELPVSLEQPLIVPPPGATAATPAVQPVAPGVAATVPATPPQPRGFWKKLRLWLNTPWQTRWKDIDSQP